MGGKKVFHCRLSRGLWHKHANSSHYQLFISNPTMTQTATFLSFVSLSQVLALGRPPMAPKRGGKFNNNFMPSTDV